MSTEDLAILADALTFALIVTIGGLILWAVIRSTWRRPALQRAMKVSVSAAALIAVGIAGVAVWEPAREGVTTVADAVGIETGRPGPTSDDPSVLLAAPEFALSEGKSRPPRVFEVASIGTDGGTDPSPTPVDLPGDPGGGGGDPGGGGGTTPPPPTPVCSDGVDNDGDGLTDSADPGCGSATDSTEFNAPPPPELACSDGADNDGDGLTDFPADPGCDSASDNAEFNAPPPPDPACSDGADNDGDGLTDSADPGCDNPADDSEFNAPPPPDPACSDGEDNDGDGLTDSADPGCDNPADDSEFNAPPPPDPACSDGEDNDGDGLTDSADPGCDNPADDSEAPDPDQPPAARSHLDQHLGVWFARSRLAW